MECHSGRAATSKTRRFFFEELRQIATEWEMEPQRRIVKKRREKEEKGEKKSTALKKILTLHVASQNIHWKATLSAKLLLTQKFHSFTNTHFQKKMLLFILLFPVWMAVPISVFVFKHIDGLEFRKG